MPFGKKKKEEEIIVSCFFMLWIIRMINHRTYGILKRASRLNTLDDIFVYLMFISTLLFLKVFGLEKFVIHRIFF